MTTRSQSASHLSTIPGTGRTATATVDGKQTINDYSLEFSSNEVKKVANKRNKSSNSYKGKSFSNRENKNISPFEPN